MKEEKAKAVSEIRSKILSLFFLYAFVIQTFLCDSRSRVPSNFFFLLDKFHFLFNKLMQEGGLCSQWWNRV